MAEQIVQNQIGFAPEIAPFGTQLLGQAQALTDTTKNPYQSYTDWAKSQGLSGDQLAQFSGLQNQAFGAAGNIGQDPFSQQSAQGILQNAQTSFGQPQAQQYMSPYMQSVVENQQRDAQRQADIATTGRNAQAVGSGAFGGSRQAIMDAEANRNLALQKGDIQSTGLQNAYTQAQSQFNADQQRQLQGLGALGSQGQNLYGQTTGNINLQSQLGGVQQQQNQNMLNTSQQNYATQQNYPYKQLGFMSDIVRGSPVSNLGNSVYSSAPSGLQTAAGLGSIYQAFNTPTTKAANGGVMKSSGINALALSRM
jgi:hypothetical protein